jgi:hypothetical protein
MVLDDEDATGVHGRFKREAVALLASRGRPLMQVAAARGIQPLLLRRWRAVTHRLPPAGRVPASGVAGR